MGVRVDIESYGIEKGGEVRVEKQFIIKDILRGVYKKILSLYVNDDLLSVPGEISFTKEALNLMIEEGVKEDILIKNEILFEQEKIRNSEYLRFALDEVLIPKKINYEKSFLIDLLLRLSLSDGRICDGNNKYIGDNMKFCSFNSEFIGGDNGYLLLLIYAVLKNGEIDLEYFGKVLNDNFRDYSFGAFVNAVQRLEDLNKLY